jgi:hypothetical protein
MYLVKTRKRMSQLYHGQCLSFRRSNGDAGRKEAIEAFIEECETMGTLEEVLEESGFIKVDDSWESRKPVSEESLAIAR